MAMGWRQILRCRRAFFNPFLAKGSDFLPTFPQLSRFSSKSLPPYAVKVGIPEFLNGIGRGTENHLAKLESKIGDLNKLLVTRTLGLKKLGIPCKHRKLILKFTHKYRLGLWRPRIDAAPKPKA